MALLHTHGVNGNGPLKRLACDGEPRARLQAAEAQVYTVQVQLHAHSYSAGLTAVRRPPRPQPELHRLTMDMCGFKMPRLHLSAPRT